MEEARRQRGAATRGRVSARLRGVTHYLVLRSLISVGIPSIAVWIFRSIRIFVVLVGGIRVRRRVWASFSAPTTPTCRARILISSVVDAAPFLLPFSHEFLSDEDVRLGFPNEPGFIFAEKGAIRNVLDALRAVDEGDVAGIVVVISHLTLALLATAPSERRGNARIAL